MIKDCKWRLCSLTGGGGVSQGPILGPRQLQCGQKCTERIWAAAGRRNELRRGPTAETRSGIAALPTGMGLFTQGPTPLKRAVAVSGKRHRHCGNHMNIGCRRFFRGDFTAARRLEPCPLLGRRAGRGVWAGAALPAVPGGGGATPTYMAQNDPRVALAILTTHMWGKFFS